MALNKNKILLKQYLNILQKNGNKMGAYKKFMCAPQQLNEYNLYKSLFTILELKNKKNIQYNYISARKSLLLKLKLIKSYLKTLHNIYTKLADNKHQELHKIMSANILSL